MRALLSGMEWLPDEPGAGGLPRYFYGLARTLPVTGVGATALVSHLSDKCPSSDVPLIAMGVPGASLFSVWKGASSALRNCLQSGVDIVNVHFALYALPIVRKLPVGVPLIVHFHGPWAEETAAEHAGLHGRLRRMIARRIELAVYRRAVRFVTLSNAFARILCERYGITEERVRVIPGGVDLRSFLAAPSRRAAREQLGWPTDRPVLLTVRRLVHRMGLEMLIDAMKRIRCRCPDALLMIGGKGPLAGELQARVNSTGLRDHVRFLGLVPEAALPATYAAADLSIVPSTKLEGFGLVTVECLGSGTAVLGTPIGGTPEILNTLDPFLVLDAPSAQAIADRAIAVLRDSAQVPTSEACRLHAARYDWEQVTPRVRDVYDEAAALSRS